MPCDIHESLGSEILYMQLCEKAGGHTLHINNWYKVGSSI